jgi:hypothetical protein
MKHYLFLRATPIVIYSILLLSITLGYFINPLWSIGIYQTLIIYQILDAMLKVIGYVFTENEIQNAKLLTPLLIPNGKFKHIILIPNYNESLSTIFCLINSLEKGIVPNENIHIILACEEKEGSYTINKKLQDILIKYEKSSFGSINLTYHQLVENEEVAGKASNLEYACSQIETMPFFKEIIAGGSKDHHFLLSIMDADTFLPNNYLILLENKYLETFEEWRDHSIYQAPISSFLNYRDQPFFSKFLSLFVTFNDYSKMTNPLEVRFPFSCYSVSYGFWKRYHFDKKCIAEDLHNYLNAYKQSPSLCKVINIYTPLYNTNISSEQPFNGPPVAPPTFSDRIGYFLEDVKTRYQMSLRHGWGINEFVYYNRVEVGSTSPTSILEKVPNQYKKQPEESYFFYLLRLPRTILINWKLIESHFQVAVVLPVIVLFPIVIRVFNYPLFTEKIGWNTLIGYLNFVMILFQMFIYTSYYTFADDVNKKISQNVIPRALNNSIITFFYHLDFYLWISLTFDIIKMWILAPLTLFVFGVIPAWVNAIRLLYVEQIEYKVSPHFTGVSVN